MRRRKPTHFSQNLIILRTAVQREGFVRDFEADAVRDFVKAHLLVRRTRPRSADAATGSARRPDSTAVFRIIPYTSPPPKVHTTVSPPTSLRQHHTPPIKQPLHCHFTASAQPPSHKYLVCKRLPHPTLSPCLPKEPLPISPPPSAPPLATTPTITKSASPQVLRPPPLPPPPPAQPASASVASKRPSSPSPLRPPLALAQRSQPPLAPS
jgi:protein TonB